MALPNGARSGRRKEAVGCGQLRAAERFDGEGLLSAGQTMQTTFLRDETPDEWVVFHDESICGKENFLYHGYLFVRKSEGRRILDEVLQPAEDLKDNVSKRIHFTALRGLRGTRARTALHWINRARDSWLIGGSLRFYCLGINLDNVNYKLYRDSGLFSSGLPSKKDRVYRRFYEIGLRASLAWFQINPERVTHLYYDQGKQDIDRFNKSLTVCGSGTVIRPLYNDCDLSGTDLSKFLQVTDVLLGTIRKTFCPISAGVTTQRKCVEGLYDVVTRQLNESTKYRKEDRYWRKFCISFFPASSGITAEEFFVRDLEYYRKSKDAFYSKRKTHLERISEEAQYPLF